MCGIIPLILPVLRHKRMTRRLKNAVGFSFQFSKKGIDKSGLFGIILPVDAGVAHPVERHLAKVEVASSSLVTRSSKKA